MSVLKRDFFFLLMKYVGFVKFAKNCLLDQGGYYWGNYYYYGFFFFLVQLFPLREIRKKK